MADLTQIVGCTNNPSHAVTSAMNTASGVLRFGHCPIKRLSTKPRIAAKNLARGGAARVIGWELGKDALP